MPRAWNPVTDDHMTIPDGERQWAEDGSMVLKFVILSSLHRSGSTLTKYLSCTNKELLQVLEIVLLEPALLPLRAILLRVCRSQVFEDSSPQSGVEVLSKPVRKGS